ncbi:MAG: hypothetical protein AAFW84_19995 [Cyanobacteria bacterium J06635_15]
MKRQLIGTICLKTTGQWLANLFVQEKEFGGEYVAERQIQGQKKMTWTGAKIQHVMDSVEAWVDMGEVYVSQRVGKPKNLSPRS